MAETLAAGETYKTVTIYLGLKRGNLDMIVQNFKNLLI